MREGRIPAILGSFTIQVYGSPYNVVDGLVKVPNGALKSKLYKQNAPFENGKYVLEDPIAMQKRIEEDVVDVQAERVRNARLVSAILACVLTCCCIVLQAKVRAALEAESATRSSRSTMHASPAS